jgi:hypothetical protein
MILAIFYANMKATSDISTTNHNKELKPDTALSTIHADVTESDFGVTDDYFVETNKKEQNATQYNRNFNSFDKINCSVASNRYAKENCSTNKPTISNKMRLTYRDFKEYKYYKNVYNIMPYASNIPGLITNLLTVVVAANIKPQQPSEICMVALGTSDFIMVSLRCAQKLWTIYDDLKISAVCKVPNYMMHVSLVYSNLILMFWTVERFIAVFFTDEISNMVFYQKY